LGWNLSASRKILVSLSSVCQKLLNGVLTKKLQFFALGIAYNFEDKYTILYTDDISITPHIRTQLRDATESSGAMEGGNAASPRAALYREGIWRW